jgi:hypothetical protein
MRYRAATLLARKAYTADGVETIDIDVADPISQICIMYECTGYSTATFNGHPALCITKIELVDGSDVLYSLSGKEAQAADFYHNKIVPPNLMYYLNDINAEMIFNLNFGRFLYDPMLALDPRKFTNLQLKVTVDINGGGRSSDGGYLTATAHLFDEKKIAPIGFLMHKEIKSYTLSASAHEYTDLPTDYAYRKIFIKAQAYAYYPDVQVSNVKLSEDVDKRVIMDQGMRQLIRSIQSLTPPYIEHIHTSCPSASGDTNYCTPAYECGFAATPWDVPASGTTTLAVDYGDGGRFRASSSSTIGNIQLIARGWLPHATVEIPFGQQNEIDDWYDVTKVGNLKLDLTGGSGLGSGTAEVFLQQLRKY